MQATPHSSRSAHNDRLLAFNQLLIDQALALVAAHAAPSAWRYEGPVGSHLRHVIEHYEALVFGQAHGIVDYDSRARDRELERSTTLARERLLALRARLGALAPLALATPVRVHGQSGAIGEFIFDVASSVARELAFVASHTVHHFALLASHCRENGIPTPADFGQAPSTVAHARAMSAPTSRPSQEPACPASLPSV